MNDTLEQLNAINADAILRLEPILCPQGYRPERPEPKHPILTDDELREVLAQNQAFFLRTAAAYIFLARRGYAALVERFGSDTAARLVKVQAMYIELLLVHKLCRDQLPESKGANL